jgi:protease-4
LWVFVGLLIFGLVASLLVCAGLAVSLFAKNVAKVNVAGKAHHLLSRERPVDEEPTMTEVWSYGHGDKKVVRIAVEGVIMRGEEGGFLEAPVDRIESVLAQIRAAKNDEDIRAIILEVDSPGGGVTPSDEIYSALKDFKDSQDKRKVVVFMRDLAASGGYYVSMAGDWLIAEPTTIVGSIGVIMGSMNFKGLAEKVGVKDVTIKSGKNKDLLNPLTDIDSNQVAILQKMIDATFERFFGIVKDSRQIKDATLRELADGRVFDSGEALKLRLVDQIGYWDDAVKKVAELLGEKDVKIVRYETHVNLLDRLLSAEARGPALSLENLKQAARPKMQYLWQP